MNIYKTFLLTLLFLPLTALAQQHLYHKALDKYQSGQWQKALEITQKLIKKYPDFDKAYLLAGQIYYEKIDKERAIPFLKKYYSLSHDARSLSELGYINFETSRYDSAIKYFSLYLVSGKARDTTEIKHLIATARFRIWAYKHPVPFKPVPLPPQINTRYDEYFPDISANGKLFFTRRINDENIYYTQKINNNWTNPQPLPGIDTKNQEGACSISPDGKTMIFTRCLIRTGCDLYITTLTDTGWTKPKKLPYPINTKHWESQPCLANNGRTLFFVSSRPGGKGKLDIWAVDYINGKWQNLRNLGDSINTPGNEMSPFLHFDNKTLYFSSDYHPGLGGYDLFISRKKNGHWSKARNLGYPINNKYDDVRLIVLPSGDTAIFSSQISGNHNLYMFRLYPSVRPTPTLFLSGKCLNGQTHHSLKATISVVNLDNDSLIYSATTDNFLISIPVGNYAFFAEKQGFTFASKNFSATDTSNGQKFVYVSVKLFPLKKNLTFELHNIFFETNSYKLKPQSYTELKKVVRFLKNNPNIHIEIDGHTDSIGTYQYNMDLSEKRSREVARYIIAHGISPDRITTRGYGFTRPKASNKTPEGRKLNRRVEIKITKI